MIAQRSEAHVMNVAWFASLVSAPRIGGDSVGKHGVVALSECRLHDLRLARARISVSLLCPGFGMTSLADAARYRRHPAPAPTPIVVVRHVERQMPRRRLYVLTHPGSERGIQQRARATQDRQMPPIGRP